MAQVYGFTAMPPMPPEPAETEARAAAVRSLLGYARDCPQSIIGLAPEGYDSPDGRLMLPPAGAGRMVYHLCRSGRLVLPAGLYEMDGQLCLCLGTPYTLETPSNLNPTDLDLYVRQQVMAKVAGLLPESLRGLFA
jgi:hypothetical protein